MKKILFVGAEAMPFAATGGLGDVLGSLPTALAKEGLDVRVVMPLYSAVGEVWRKDMKKLAEFEVSLSWRKQYCAIFSLEKEGVVYYFVDNEYYFLRDTLYGQFDDGERFAFFSMASVEMMKHINFYPDVLHAHDWQSALSVVYLNHIYKRDKKYQHIKTVFTIHNIEYQGKYDFSILGDVFSLGEAERSLMEHSGLINLMKGAIEDADRVTTVSERYADEIKTPEYAHGLEASLNGASAKLMGILNGIDYSYYDPKSDKSIAQNYSSANLEGKRACKRALQRELHLEERDVPLLSIISRLASHKGLDIIEASIYDIVSTSDIQLVVLGRGEEKYEQFFAYLANTFPNKVRALITYDRELSKRIYSASDIFLMPSKSEPCGLSQMIASRYGAIPVVRETGGLFDSIKPYYEVKGRIFGNGFTFAGYSADELKERTRACIALWQDEEKRQKFTRKIMRTDFSWTASAKKYCRMYEEL